MHYLLIHDVVPDYTERRGAHRDEHLALARAALARGELVLGGALAGPIDSAVLLFEANDARVVERFVAADLMRRGLLARTLERWSSRDLLTSWAAYWPRSSQYRLDPPQSPWRA